MEDCNPVAPLSGACHNTGHRVLDMLEQGDGRCWKSIAQKIFIVQQTPLFQIRKCFGKCFHWLKLS